MKYILIFILLFNISLNKKYIVCDVNTNELLVGVKINTNKNKTHYTDFNGEVIVNSKIKNIEYISYDEYFIRNDTIFMNNK